MYHGLVSMPDIQCAALYGWQVAVEFNNSNDSFTKHGTNTMTKVHESRDIHGKNIHIRQQQPRVINNL